MHELAICQSLIDQVEAIAHERQAESVVSITIRLGALSGVEPQLLKHAYPVASAGTVARDAELMIDELPTRIRCNACETESDVPPNKLVCPACGEWRTTLISGDELLLMSVELQTAENRGGDAPPTS
ncbi:hydrogenase nickel incorporation protein HypA [Solemya velum gill symbiont]|uniref:hydrogenase maturation nickel metallochaperone HypA/HybF n=1 Tax=Solemya velum gill symbiont TaxID=2340 RepID=UPI0009967CF2|nr:hydrogenase maturation nickel metallochaperone HypA [Solemya velum gill symbiont]OOZ73734.1 hydrogenase nickel incorporation protein HypA [Solemya velum gill symbiont]